MRNLTFTSALLLLAATALSQGIRINAHMILKSNAIMYVDGDIHIEGGELHIDANSELRLSDQKTLSVGTDGTLNLTGISGEQAVITSVGYFLFLINSGGTISAQYATFEKMSGNGLHIQPGALIDPDFPLNNSIFQNGAPGSTFLTINNSQVLTIDGVSFIQTGTEAFNVAKTSDMGDIIFASYSGNFAGHDFENDGFNRIHWGNLPLIQWVDGITIHNGDDFCLDAFKTITVQNLIVQSGGSLDLVAGQNILLIPGIMVNNGGNLHAWISTNGIFCNTASMLAAIENHEEPFEMNQQTASEISAIRAWPNPTTGKFTLEIILPQEVTTIQVEVYGITGNCLMHKELPASSLYTFDISSRQPGMYIIRVVYGNLTEFVKIIKQ